ncbi:nucleotide-binding oligomerization domain-containing protein 2-like [Apostichopus japonicus]|uniref:nucleotide-binding oligomerization domain-containing protein 2-like n=1 Tax=Stichopus japonicus TaxID=307972 RepID=UPI003AB2EBE8
MLNQSHPKVYVPNNLYLRTQHGNWRNRSRGDKLNGYQDLFKNEKLKNRNLFIEGDMGFGKTTLALQFIKMWLNEDQNLDFGLVLYLSLQNVAFENEYTCIRTQLLSETCDIDDITIQEIIANEERVLFVFDDWDQFNNRHSKKSFVYKLFVNKQKEEHKVLILTRPSLAGEVFSDERPIVKIAQFDDEQIQKYLKETLKRKNINGIFEGIVDNSSIYELCQIPLFLSVIAPIIEDDMFNIEHDETVTKLFLSVFPSLINRKEAGNDGALALFDYNPKLALLAAAGYTTQESFWPKEKVASLIGRTELNDLIKTKILTETSERKQLSEDLLKMESKCKIHFSHNIFQCFYGAHYLAFDASSEEIGDYLHNTDILICQYLFIFACGLSNDKQLLVTIVRSLLQREEYYPFPISDCIALCCFEAKPGKLEHKLLSEISASEHRFHIKASDGRNVVNAKAFLIDSCAKEKVEFGSLAITEHVKEIGSDKITLSTGTSFELPGIIKSYYIVAFENKITNEDLLALIKGSRRLQILFLYNKSEPEYECAELFETTDLEKTLVVWVYCQAEDLTLFTLSSKFKCWTSLEGSLTIKELRKTDLWKDSAVSSFNSVLPV